jgi:hypothetical protein
MMDLRAASLDRLAREGNDRSSKPQGRWLTYTAAFN